MLLSRVTLSYDVREDRLRLAGETPNGDIVALWLTHRLLIRLLPHLLWLLEAHSDSGAVAAERSPQASEPKSTADVLPTADTPVVPEAGSAQFLVLAVDFTEEQGHVVLTFRDSSQAARLAMNPEQLALWVAGVQQCAAKGEWQVPNAAIAPAGLLAGAPDSVTIH